MQLFSIRFHCSSFPSARPHHRSIQLHIKVSFTPPDCSSVSFSSTSLPSSSCLPSLFFLYLPSHSSFSLISLFYFRLLFFLSFPRCSSVSFSTSPPSSFFLPSLYLPYHPSLSLPFLIFFLLLFFFSLLTESSDFFFYLTFLSFPSVSYYAEAP